MDPINFAISVILALIGTILTLLVSIFNSRLTKRREAEKEKQEAEKEKNRQEKERRDKLLGPGGIPPKTVEEAVLIVREEKSEKRQAILPTAGGSNILLRLIIVFFVISTASYLFINNQGASPVNGTPTPIPQLAIVTGGPCQLTPGNTLPLSVTGIPGTDVAYRWLATRGNINPPNNAAVTYTAPNTPGDDIITVVAQKGDTALQATITCKVIGPTLTPVKNATIPPTFTPIPSSTAWACTSYRFPKVQDIDIPGDVKIEIPPQGTDIPSGRNVLVAGTHTGIPAGKYLWVFVYSPQAGTHGRYYPQTKDAINGWQPEPTTWQDGLWSLDVNFGAPDECYEVIVMLANATTSQSIADQLQAWATINNYTGYELDGPPSTDPPDAPGLPDGLVEKASIEVKTK